MCPPNLSSPKVTGGSVTKYFIQCELFLPGPADNGVGKGHTQQGVLAHPIPFVSGPKCHRLLVSAPGVRRHQLLILVSGVECHQLLILVSGVERHPFLNAGSGV